MSACAELRDRRPAFADGALAGASSRPRGGSASGRTWRPIASSRPRTASGSGGRTAPAATKARPRPRQGPDAGPQRQPPVPQKAPPAR
jgi:hypothetical protein